MRLEAVSITNFRCYDEEVRIELGDLTTFVGRNDIGKSAILETLEIFFNGDLVSMEQGDASVHNADKTVSITCEFSELPSTLTLDAGAETTLADEYLLAQDGRLKIRKTFDCTSKKPSAEVLVIANHPTADDCANLLELKEKDLQKRVKDLGLDVALKGNPGMRRAIWAAAGDLRLREVARGVAALLGEDVLVLEVEEGQSAVIILEVGREIQVVGVGALHAHPALAETQPLEAMAVLVHAERIGERTDVGSIRLPLGGIDRGLIEGGEYTEHVFKENLVDPG